MTSYLGVLTLITLLRDEAKYLFGRLSGGEGKKGDAEDDEPVISISHRRVQQILEQRCNRFDVRYSGIPNLGHTCRTWLYQEPRDLQVVVRHLEHSSTKTAEINAYLADTDYEGAVNALDTNWVK